MLVLGQVIIILAIIFAVFQVVGIVRIKGSKVKAGWVVSALAVVGIAEYVVYRFIEVGSERTYLILFIAVSLCANLVKFTLGLIQDDEMTAYNRFEHFVAGVLMYFFLASVGILNVFSITTGSEIIGGFVVVLFVNLLSVLFEIVELLIDRVRGKRYLIGPKAYDTNMDVAMVLIGSVVAMIGQMMLK